MVVSNYQEMSDRIIEMINNDMYDDAFEELKQLDANGDKDATAILAQFYLHGIGIAADIEHAIELLNKAIAMGSSDAAWELGMVYYKNDLGVPIDKYKAVILFEKGAQGGNENCCGMLSDCYLYGEGTEINETKAFQYALIAARAGNTIGLLNAGICYDDGIGTTKDPSSACYWYKEYLNRDSEDDFIMMRVALCLSDPYERFGIRPTKDMLNEAFYYAREALEKGNIEAQLIVGWFYEKGEVVPQDFDLAHKYVQNAADSGNEVAQRHIKDFRKNLYGNYFIPGY